MGDTFYILSIDGGGFRGVFPAHILKRMEEEWRLDWRSRFGLFAGTSTGSILTAGLACGISATRLADFYKEHGAEIFKKRWFFNPGRFLASGYSNKVLQKLLEEELRGLTLGEVKAPLILPSVDIGNGCVHVFKSKYDEEFVRDPNVRVSDAVLSSCSAPTFFDPHTVDDKYLLTDGGLWANNPSLVAVLDAYRRLDIQLEDIKVLSIGTGKSRSFYPQSESARGLWKRIFSGWGLLTGWQGAKLLELILNLQSDTAHNMLCLLLGEKPGESKQVLRVSFESDTHLPMDQTDRYNDWISKADHEFSHRSKQIASFLEVV